MIAREDKGILLGYDYNKSPKAFIRTTNDKASYGTCEQDNDVCTPTFKDVPMVEQIDTTSVKVSWPDTVTNLECGENELNI